MVQRQTKKLIAVSGRRARITRLDSCGRLVYGDGNVVVTNGYTSIKANTNSTATDAVVVTNANGDTLLNVPAVSSFSNVGLDITFAEVDPELFSLVTGQRVIFDAFGNPVGFALNSKVIASNVAFALEVWMGAPSSATCAVGAQGSYGYALFPFCGGGIVGDHEISQGLINFSISGVFTKDGNAWGKGPYKVTLNSSNTPDLLPFALDTNDHEQIFSTSVNPPDATVGTRPQLDPSATAITAITNTNTGRVYTLGATPAVAAGVGTYWDYGDGTWEYVTAAGSATTHTYANAGTYLLTASTNGTQVTKSITVT